MIYSAHLRDELANQIIERLNVFAADCTAPSQIEEAALRRDIAKVKNVSLADYYDLLGMLCALLHDVDAMREHHARAIEVSGNNPDYQVHYGVSLTKLDLYDDAIEVLRRVLQKVPGDVETLDALINTTLSAGHYHAANELVDVWGRLFPDKPHEEKANLKQHIIPYLLEHEVRDEDVARVNSSARAVLAENNITPVGASARVPKEDDDSGLCIIYYVTASIETIADLVDRLCECEADLDPHGKLPLTVMASFAAAG